MGTACKGKHGVISTRSPAAETRSRTTRRTTREWRREGSDRSTGAGHIGNRARGRAPRSPAWRCETGHDRINDGQHATAPPASPCHSRTVTEGASVNTGQLHHMGLFPAPFKNGKQSKKIVLIHKNNTLKKPNDTCIYFYLAMFET